MKLYQKSFFCLIFFFTLIMLSGCASNSIDHRNWNQATSNIIHQYSASTYDSLEPRFQQVGLHYPPHNLAILAFKRERQIELWAKDYGAWHYIKNYPLKAFSGHLGPKLLDHDGQIPEGIYRITLLNPFSTVHLSMKLNYPNSFDRYYAAQDGRQQLGGDIFIHGRALSVGCLAIGDPAINQLFVLVDKVGMGNTEVIIAPNDLRRENAMTNFHKEPSWLPNLYGQIKAHLSPFKRASLA